MSEHALRVSGVPHHRRRPTGAVFIRRGMGEGRIHRSRRLGRYRPLRPEEGGSPPGRARSRALRAQLTSSLSSYERRATRRLLEVLGRPDDLAARELVHVLRAAAGRLQADPVVGQPRDRHRRVLPALPPVRACHRRLGRSRRPEAHDDRSRSRSRGGHRDHPLAVVSRCTLGRMDLRGCVRDGHADDRLRLGTVRSTPQPRFHGRPRDRQRAFSGELLRCDGRRAAPRRRSRRGRRRSRQSSSSTRRRSSPQPPRSAFVRSELQPRGAARAKAHPAGCQRGAPLRARPSRVCGTSR